MKVASVQNQPNFKANFNNDAVTQGVLRKVRRGVKDEGTRQLLDSCFNIMGLVRKNETIMLNVTKDNKLVVKPKNFFKDLFGKNERFESEINNGNIADAFINVCTKAFRGW